MADNTEIVYTLKNFSSATQTGEFLADEISTIIEEIGPKKIGAFVTDHGGNIRVARRLITTKYTHILNIRCIAHTLNLIATDFAKNQTINNIAEKAMKIFAFFKYNPEKSSLTRKMRQLQ